MLHKKELVAGIIILFISWFTYQGYETLFFFRIPLYEKHLINFFLLISVALVGYYVWSRHPQKWTLLVWNTAYIFILGLMAFIGVLDLFFKFEISNFREMIHNLRMFFTSPVPYGIILFLVNRLNEKEQYKAKEQEPASKETIESQALKAVPK